MTASELLDYCLAKRLETERDALRETLQHIGTGAGRAVRLAMNGKPPQDKKEKK